MIQIVIPARLASTRLPQKMLADLGGMPLIVRTARNAQRSGYPVLVAYDDAQIGAVLQQAQIEALLTSSQHQNGSERLAEVVALKDWADESIIVNVQGDEPFLPPAAIETVIKALQQNPQAEVATLATSISAAEALAPQVVKVVCNQHQEALYFSRAPIPHDRDDRGATYRRHIGIYAYRAGILRRYPQWSSTPLERFEQLEQLRFLEYGIRIAVADFNPAPPAGIDTAEDLARARAEIHIWKEEE